MVAASLAPSSWEMEGPRLCSLWECPAILVRWGGRAVSSITLLGLGWNSWEIEKYVKKVKSEFICPLLLVPRAFTFSSSVLQPGGPGVSFNGRWGSWLMAQKAALKQISVSVGHFKYMAATDLTVTLRTTTVTLHHGHAGALGTLPDVTEFALASWEWWKIWWLYWTSPFLTALHLLTSATPLPSALSKYTFSTLVHCLHSVAPFSALPQNPGANEACVVFLSCQGPDFIIHKTGADSSCFPQSGLGFYKTVDMEMPIDSYPHPAVLLVLLLWRVFVCNAFDPKLGIVGDWSGSNALCS